MIDVDWQAVFRELSAAYGWTPTEIAELTPAQLSAYLESNRTNNTQWMTPAEMRDFRRRLRTTNG